MPNVKGLRGFNKGAADGLWSQVSQMSTEQAKFAKSDHTGTLLIRQCSLLVSWCLSDGCWRGVGKRQGFTCIVEASLGPYQKQPSSQSAPLASIRIRILTLPSTSSKSHLCPAVCPWIRRSCKRDIWKKTDSRSDGLAGPVGRVPFRVSIRSKPSSSSRGCIYDRRHKQ